MSDDVVQVWVRTDKGQVFGPLSPPSVELLIDNGVLLGRVQVSLDGSNYVFPGRMPGIRMVFPKQLWGEGPLPPSELDEAWSKAVPPAPLPNTETGPRPPTTGAAAPAPGPGAVMAGPGAVAAGPGAIRAGPGARAQAQARPMNPAQASQGRAPTPGVQRPTAAPAGPLADTLFSDVVPAAPVTGAVRMVAPAAKPPSSSASIAAAMGSAPPPAPARAQAAAIAAAMGMPMPPQAMAPTAPHPPTPAPPPQAHPEGPTSAPSSVAIAPLDSIPAAGSLRDLSTRRLYFLAAAQDLTGLLSIQLPDRSLTIHFRKGSPDLVDSTHGEDALASFLMRQRLVTPEQLGQAQRELGRFGGELLPALFGLGLVNPNVAMESLAQRAANLVGQVLLSFDGAFSFQPIELSPHKAMPAGNRWQLYCEQLRRLPVSELRLRLRDALDFPVMKASGAVPVTNLRLSPQESRAYASFDGTRTLNQMLATHPAEAEHALRVAFMLEPCDLVSFAGTVIPASAPSQVSAPAFVPPPAQPAPAPVMVAPAPAAPVVPAPPVAVAPIGRPPGVPAPPGAPGARPAVPVPPGARPPGVPVPPGAPGARPPIPPPVMQPAAPAAPRPPVITASHPVTAAPTTRPSAVAPAPTSRPSSAGAPASFDAEVKKLQELFLKMKTQNHFEVLGVGRDIQPNQVKVAYFKLAKDFHPDTVPPGAPEALSKAKADVFARIGEAHRTLADEHLRAEYVAELDAGGAGEKIDVSKFLQAEEFFQKGKLLVQARKFAEALKMFDDSVALIPDDAEPHAWRGYARFFAATDKKAILPQALKDITECTKRNPNIAQAQFFQGMMHKVLGDLAQAKKFFSQTVKLDPKHIDAQRELRLMK